MPKLRLGVSAAVGRVESTSPLDGAGELATRRSTTTPVRPSTTTSGTDPLARATTGVPQAIASTITIPNGSSHRMGKRRQRAPASRSRFSRRVGIADVDRIRPEPGRDLGVVELLLGRLGTLAGEEDPDPGRPCGVDREVRALRRRGTGRGRGRSRPCAPGTGSRARRSPLWTVPTQFRSDAERRWFSRDRHQRQVGAERSVDVVQLVHRAVDRDHGRHPSAAGQEWTGQGVVVHDVVVGAGPDEGRDPGGVAPPPGGLRPAGRWAAPPTSG